MLLWSGLLSPYSAKVRIACAEKGIRYDLREIHWSRATLWNPKPAELLAVSPRGQIPVLIDGDAVITDSTVIIEYLDERFPEPPLLPRDPVTRAHCRLLEDDADRAMQTDVSTLIREVFLKGDAATRDEAAIGEAMANLRAFYAELERRLANEDYLCGAFSIADTPAFLVVGYAGLMGLPVPTDHRHLTAWFGRMRARETVGREFDAMLAAVAKV